jgi:hypothetical protein
MTLLLRLLLLLNSKDYYQENPLRIKIVILNRGIKP